MSSQRTRALMHKDQDAALRYELARQRLALALAERIEQLDRFPPGTPADRLLLERRKAVVDEGFAYVGPLARYVQAEIARWTDETSDADDIAAVDDIIAATYLAALDEVDGAPPARALYTWLRRIARREVREVIVAESGRRQSEWSLETPIAVTGRNWPARVIRVLDVLADPRAPLPEELVIDAETQAVLVLALARLPEHWREVFLLRVVDGWPEVDIAAAEGLAVHDVTVIVNDCRMFMREWLEVEAEPSPA
jgi:RNA polymerase sigma factor (sigma-70 family)